MKLLNFKNEPILTIINLVLYILLILVIYQLLLTIIGKSPIFETIVISLLSVLIVNSFRYEFLLGKFLGEYNEFKKNVITSFQNMKEDIIKLKEK